MNQDPFLQFKLAQKQSWALFAPLEAWTAPAASYLVDFAEVRSEQRVLDVACGTGVVAVTAALRGARVNGLDLAPSLLEQAGWNAKIAGVNIELTEGDVEALPYADASFDVVLSQFGHIFAPRPEVALEEMLRVLKPEGRIAFSTWPPEHFTAQMFTLVSQYLPPPTGVAPPPLWGDPNKVKERLGKRVSGLRFEREMVTPAALSPQHFRLMLEPTAGPLIKLVETLQEEDPQRLAKFREEMDNLITHYWRGNRLRQHFLMTRADKLS